MRTIARGLLALLDKPVRAVSVILGLFVGALLGAPNDPGATTHTVQARKGGRPGRLAPPGVSGPDLSIRVRGRKALRGLRAAAGPRYGA
jgi:hypothetical protein